MIFFILVFCPKCDSNSMKSTDIPNLVNTLWTNYFSVSKTYSGSITQFNLLLFALLSNNFKISCYYLNQPTPNKSRLWVYDFWNENTAWCCHYVVWCRYVISVAFSADGRYLASGSNDKTVMIWKLQSEQQIFSNDKK